MTGRGLRQLPALARQSCGTHMTGCVNGSCHEYKWVVAQTWQGTGWRRLKGSPKLQINFHKRAIKYRSLLRKMTNKDKGSYESSPPCRAFWWTMTYKHKASYDSMPPCIWVWYHVEKQSLVSCRKQSQLSTWKTKSAFHLGLISWGKQSLEKMPLSAGHTVSIRHPIYVGLISCGKLSLVSVFHIYWESDWPRVAGG